MFDKQTIQHLQQSQAAINAATLLEAASLDSKAIVLPDGVNIQSLERYMPERFRFRGNMKTESIEDFCNYCNSKVEISTYINANHMAAEAFFNLGNESEPGHGDDTAEISLKTSAAYQALLRINDKRMDQQGAAEFIEDWQAFISSITGDQQEDITVKVAATSLRSIKIEATTSTDSEVHNFGRERSARESIQAQTKASRPNFIEFTCEPYAGMPKRTFVLRVGILTSSDPKVVFRIINKENHEEEMAQEFKDILRKQLDDKANVYVGSFSVK